MKGRCLTRKRLWVADRAGESAVPVKDAGAVIAWYDLQQALLSQLPKESVSLDSAVKEVRSIVAQGMCSTLRCL